MNLDHGPSFEALSYTWGEASFTEPLNIDGRVKYVTPNLRDALSHLRRRLEPRYLWVDAVCINQDDDVEKSRQIPFMFKIYRRASAVLVWLGCGAKEADDLAQIQSFCRHYDGSSDWQNLGISKLFRSFVTLPWFSRLWIVQEVVLNPNVTLVCGASELTWTQFMRLVRILQKSKVKVGSAILSMVSLWQSWSLESENATDKGTTIIELLRMFDRPICSDARDRVYALAGLAKDVNLVWGTAAANPDSRDIKNIVVDYSKTVDEVYMDIGWAMAGFDVSSDTTWSDWEKRILGLAMRRSIGRLMTNCSWLPDWRHPEVRSLIWDGWNNNYHDMF